MKKTILILSVAFLGGISLNSCGGNETIQEKENKVTNETSEENQEVPIEVTIGEQVWMTKNLDVDVFRNGDKIPEAKTRTEWEKAGENGEPVWCYYDNDPKNGEKYGKLYNWYAVIDPRGLAPDGYHIPSDAEWSQLIGDFLGSISAGKKMKSTSGWEENGNGTNSSGFSGLPGGIRLYSGCDDLGEYGKWWSTSKGWDENSASYYYLSYDVDDADFYFNDKVYGLSVRCVKN